LTVVAETFAPAVGRPLRRVEDEPLVQGLGCYVADVNRPNQVYARIVRSQVAHGWLQAVHLEDARAHEGVIAAFSAQDIPNIAETKIPIRITPSEKAAFALQTPLAVDRVRYVGEPIAVVVAVDPYVAEDAAEMVWAEIEELEPVLDPVAATQSGSPTLFEGLPDNVCGGFNLFNGEDVDQIFRGADVLVRERFHSHRHAAVPMETRGFVAELDPGTGRLTVWGQTKVKHFNRRTLAALLRIAEDDIRFLETDVGGGFGARGEFYPEDFLLPWLAVHLRRPVKWIEDRAENLVALNHSREHVFEIEMAATADGQLLGFRSTDWCSMGGYLRTNGLKVVECAGMHISGPYRWRGFSIQALGVLTTKTPLATYRGPGEVEATYARERMLDLVAATIGLDPAEVRRKNLIPADALPLEVELGPEHEPNLYDSGDYPTMFAHLLEQAGYERLKTERAERRAHGEAVGIGLACCHNEGGYGPFESARVIAEPDGTFTAHVGVAGVGQGTRTGLAQILADELGVDMERVRIFHHDTDEIKDGVGAYADRCTAVGGSAILVTVAALKERARHAGAVRLGVGPSEVELVADEVRAANGRSVTFGDLGLDETGRYEKTTTDMSFCTSLAVVSVDRATGKVTVERYIGVYDVGRTINPLLVKGQLDGAAAQGLAGTLLEEFVYDEQGQPLSTSFMDYLLPTLSELPEVESLWFEYPDENNPLGVKGAGGNGIIGAQAALSNAVADALADDGVVLTSLPLTPNHVRAMIREAGQETAA
jgi:carbon-monoxide dehydrogenase large subunit